MAEASGRVIRAMLNLRCELGHRFYSPEPNLWVGRDCDHSEQNRKCGARLRRFRTAPTRLATEGRALPYMGRRRLEQGTMRSQ